METPLFCGQSMTDGQTRYENITFPQRGKETLRCKLQAMSSTNLTVFSTFINYSNLGAIPIHKQ